VTNQAVTVTYSVTGAFGNSPTAPTGNVTVSDGTDSCTGTVAAGTCNITFSSAGSKTITSTYAGDANFNGSTSAGVAHTSTRPIRPRSLRPIRPIRRWWANPSRSPIPSPETLAIPRPPERQRHRLGRHEQLHRHGCRRHLQYHLYQPGSKTLTASYAGDTNFNASDSTTVSHTVNKADTTTTITSDTPDRPWSARRSSSITP